MPELSREAMQLMELSPSWRLRPSLRPNLNPNLSPADQALAADGVMIVVLAKNPAAQKLWSAISSAMAGLGIDGASVRDALVLQSAAPDRVIDQCSMRKPGRLMVFGEELIDALTQSGGDAIAGVAMIGLPSLESMASGQDAARLKRRTWSVLAAQRKAGA